MFAFCHADIPKIRLTGPPHREGAGIVEVFINNQWGIICDNSWGFEEAKVVCRELGFPGVKKITCCGWYFGVSSVPPLISYIRCTGSEKSLFHCQHTRSTTAACGRRESAGVICKLNKPYGKEQAVEILTQELGGGGGVELMGEGVRRLPRPPKKCA